MGTKILGFVFAGMQLLYNAYFTPVKTNYSSNPELNTNTLVEMPVAIEDHFYLALGCDNYVLTGNLLANDRINNKSSVKLASLDSPDMGTFSYDEQGNFNFEISEEFYGDIQFSYRLQDLTNPDYYTDANVVITIEGDNDCDGIVNSIDIDDDNDGILDFHEGALEEDFDNDNIPNHFDIDSDNDGITDYIEWQKESAKIKYLYSDENQDGWDDAFDSNYGGDYYEQVDTDMDGSPDFLDLDSDNDGIDDFTEAYDIDNDCIPTCIKRESDLDMDGLDDNCDNVYGWDHKTNPMGSNAPLPDFNQNNLRDWRDLTNHAPDGNDVEAETGENEIYVYPNPVQNNCTVMVPNMQNSKNNHIHVKLYNSSGSLLLLKTVTSPIFNLGFEPYTKGQYFLKVSTENGAYHQQILKTK